jgi:hypothetical protein
MIIVLRFNCLSIKSNVKNLYKGLFYFVCEKNRIYGRKPVFLPVPYRPIFLKLLYGTGNREKYIKTAVNCTAVTVIRYGAQPYECIVPVGNTSVLVLN